MFESIKTRYSKFYKWAENRIDSDARHGLFLSLGTLISVIFVTFFVKIAEDVISREPLDITDTQIMDYITSHRGVVLNKFMLLITYIGQWPTVVLGLILLSVILFLLNKRRYVFALICSTAGGQILITLLKNFAARERPPIANAIISENSFSFPSGHSFVVFSFYALATYILFRLFKNITVRFLIIIFGFLLILLVPISRIYLGAHWASDVVGSVLLGMAWFSGFFTYLFINDKYNALKETKPVVSLESIKLIAIGFTIIWLGFVFYFYNAHQLKNVIDTKIVGVNNNTNLCHSELAACPNTK